MTTVCPQCNQLADHVFVGDQKLPVRKDGKVWRDDNGKPVFDTVQLWTCENCCSTWVKGE